MLQIAWIRENKEEVVKRLEVKHFKDAAAFIDKVLAVDLEKRNAQKDADGVKAEANALAKQIGELMKSGKKDEAEQVKSKTAELKQKEKQFDEILAAKEAEIHQLLVQAPNLPSAKVPAGRTPEDNEVVFEHGAVPVLHEK